MRIALVLLLAAVTAGCGGHPSAFDGGVSAANARSHPRVRFHNLGRADFVARLDLQARRHDFRISRITWRRGYLDVPEVTIVSTHYLQLAHDVPHVLDAVDPPPRSGHIMGGQWARSQRLFPDAHG